MNFEAIKYSIISIYTVSASIFLTIKNSNDSYEQVFTDPYLWVAAFIGLGLMLFVERNDEKENVTIRNIIFSIFASLAFIFICGTIRAGMIEQSDEMQRSYYFYAIILFLCSIAPDLARRLIIETPKSISKGVNKGLERRVDTIIGGNNNENLDDHTDLIDYENDIDEHGDI